MTASLTGAVPYFDITRPGFSIKSAEVHAARELSWYARTNYGLAVLRYDQVSRLAKHPKLRQGSVAWPAHNGVTAGLFARWWATWLLNLEGEEHHRVRQLMNPAFSPRLVTTLVPRFRDLAAGLADGFAGTGRCEFVTDFGSPYAARVIAIMLGLPETEAATIARDSAVIGLALGVTLREDLPRIEQALASLYGYADELVADRRRHDRGDVVSALTRATGEDGGLSDDELRDGLVLLIFGGYDTTRNQLGLAMQTFLAHPDQWRLLAERPELGRAAVEEVMRVNPTATWVTREALEDFTFDGLGIAAGTTVHLFAQCAGTDPRAFRPAGFDITAKRKPHFGFGAGIHHCIGHYVARTDMAEALPLLARRMREPRVDGEASWLPDSGNTGPVRLPLAFTPAR